jgi:hypothetical protein
VARTAIHIRSCSSGRSTSPATKPTGPRHAGPLRTPRHQHHQPTAAAAAA